MMRSRLCAVTAVALLSACDDFNNDLSQYCVHNPLACAGDSGTGGGNGGGAGGSGGAGACLDFGSSCSADGQCCATTLVNGTAYPLACSRIHYCQIASPYCLADKSFCTSSDQCCTGSCDSVKHQCAVCGGDGDPCTSGKGCCEYELCGDDGMCHFNSVGDTLMGGQCMSSAVCSDGYCEPDAGICFNPQTAGCTPLGGTGASCCPGLEKSGTTCCEPEGEPCTGASDCCGMECWGGFCLPQQPLLGEPCDNSANCQGSTNYCDPVENVCTDRWCFGSLRTAYKGCCQISPGGFSCNFDDGGVCIMVNQGAGSDPSACCAGTATGGTCDPAYLFDP